MSSTLEVLGIRFGTLGTASSLAVAAPLSEGDYSPDAHTDAARIGVWFDRTPASEGMVLQILGTDVAKVTSSTLEIQGNPVWHSGNVTPQDTSEKGAANGYASLDSTGKLPVAQLPTSVSGGLDYLGVWDANTNSPAISDGTGVQGSFYIVSIAGSQDLGSGLINFTVGDQVIHNGLVWERVPEDGTQYLIKASAADATPGYLDAKVDGLTIDVVADQLQVIAGISAVTTTTDTTNFNDILSVADTNVQLALETLNSHGHPLTDIQELTDGGVIALTNGVPTLVDQTNSGNTFRWMIQIYTGTNYTMVEVLAAAQGDFDIEWTIYPATANFDHTISVDRSGGTTTLNITASGAGYSARAWRLELP